MRSVLRATIGVAALATVLFAAPIPARADGEYLRVTPSTIQAGFQVEIEAFCGDNVNPATVKSDAFGVVTITPREDPRTGKFIHRGTATIPAGKRPGAYPVRLTCPSNQTATTTLHVVNFDPPTKGPKTGGGALAARSFGDKGDLTMVGVGSAAVGAGALLFAASRRKRT